MPVIYAFGGALSHRLVSGRVTWGLPFPARFRCAETVSMQPGTEEVPETDSRDSLYKRKSQRQTAGTRCTRGSPRDRQQGLAVQEKVPETDSRDTMYKRKSQRQTAGTRCTRGSSRDRRPTDRQQGHDVQEEVPETGSRDTMYKRKCQRQTAGTHCDMPRQTVSMQPGTERGSPCTQPAVLVLSRTRQCAGRSGSSNCRHAP